MKFRKKPVIIEATQFLSGNHPPIAGIQWDHAGLPFIHTLEGPHLVSPGDWIITGIKGEKYPCKPDIFDATYDAVAE